MSKRKSFDEIMEGVAAMKSHREGKITLRTYKVEAAPHSTVSAFEPSFGCSSLTSPLDPYTPSSIPGFESSFGRKCRFQPEGNRLKKSFASNDLK